MSPRRAARGVTQSSDPAVSAATDREKHLLELAAASAAVGSEAALEDVLQTTVDVAARLVTARYAALGVLDRTGAHLERLFTAGIDQATRDRIGKLPSDHGVLRILLREGRPARVRDVTGEQHFFGFPTWHPMMRSFLGVPIFVRGIVFGDLYLAEKEDGQEFTEEDQELVTLLANQTGITIEKVRINEGAHHWIRQLETLNELTRSVLEERDLFSLLTLVAQRLRVLIDARGVLISLPASPGALRVVVAEGEDLADLVGSDVPSESKHARVLARATGERIDSLLTDPEVDQASAQRIGAMTALLVPLVFQQRAIGVISAFNKEGSDPRFTDDDVRLAEALGSLAALAVHLSERVARETVDAIIEGQEAERSRIARELHDETGSALTAFLLGLAAIDEAATLEDARAATTALRKNVRNALQNVGRLAFALRPPVLDEFGLVPALRDLSGGVEDQGGPRVQLDVDLPNGMRLPPKLETAIFRSTQEALTNVVKHARANSVRIALAFRDRSVTLTVEDDGRGFAPEQTPTAGFGLVGMRERVASANGTLRIESSPAAGTRLTIELPAG